MKKTIILLSLLFISDFYFSQKDLKPIKIKDEKPFSVVSKNKDTLWLLDNQIGKMIADTWNEGKFKMDPKELKPVIILVGELPAIEEPKDKNKNKKK